jgi:hypothetical protein
MPTPKVIRDCQRPGCQGKAARKYCSMTCAGLNRARTNPEHFSSMGRAGGLHGVYPKTAEWYAGYNAGYNAKVRERRKHAV